MLGAAHGKPGLSPSANAAMMDCRVLRGVGGGGQWSPPRLEACVAHGLGPQIEGTSHRPVAWILMSYNNIRHLPRVSGMLGSFRVLLSYSQKRAKHLSQTDIFSCCDPCHPAMLYTTKPDP